MNRRFLLEISVETVEAALAAQRGGADRIELCGNLSIGGVTPSIEVMRTVREQLHIPIFAIIRPRGGDFVYSEGESAEMKRSIAEAKRARMDGVALGILTNDRLVDEALEDVMQTGASRILTSGGAKSALEGAAILAELVAAAGNRITIVPGAGISASNIARVVRETGAREFHSGLGTVLSYGSHDYQRFETEVRKMTEQLASLP